MPPGEPELERALREQESRLVDEFRGRVDDGVVRRHFAEAVAGLGDARVKVYLPVLAYRLTRDRLRHPPAAPAADAAADAGG